MKQTLNRIGYDYVHVSPRVFTWPWNVIAYVRVDVVLMWQFKYN